MYKKPRFLLKKKKIEINKEYLLCLPIVNKNKEILDFQYDQLSRKKKYNFFLMAGGKGIRLLPPTKKIT